MTNRASQVSGDDLASKLGAKLAEAAYAAVYSLDSQSREEPEIVALECALENWTMAPAIPIEQPRGTPVAGGEVEVLVTQIRIIDRAPPSDWLEAEQEGLNRARANIKVNRELGGKLQYEIRELVDRAHIARLQAEVVGFQSERSFFVKRNDELHKQIADLQFHSTNEKADTTKRLEWAREAAARIDSLESDLTKARELLESIKTSHEHTRRYLPPTLEAWRARCMHTEMDVEEFLIAQQSAPAAKGDL